MIILDYKPKGFVLVIFFFMENENMHMHMITGHLNVLKLSMNSCSFVSVMNSVFTPINFLIKTFFASAERFKVERSRKLIKDKTNCVYSRSFTLHYHAACSSLSSGVLNKH